LVSYFFFLKEKEEKEAEIKKTKEREQKEKEEKEAKIKEVRIQEFLTYRAENPEVFENAKKGQEKHDRNKEELRIKKEWQLKKANEQNQIDKDDWSKPIDLNEYGISFKPLFFYS
jgi:MFS superfamily sulfate permease-like transporter